jgi:hypothetical protein
MAEHRCFKVNEGVLKGRVKECIVCEKKFELEEEIVLAPVQKPRKGFANIMCIPIHEKCFWIDKDSP